MDFADMIEYHRRKEADITIGMMVVPESEIHQFGTGITDSNQRIIEWEEKPAVPRTNLASMGIYVFNTEYLLERLNEDREAVDFGMHIIPNALAKDQVFAYPFRGYWRDVGTIQAYWEANMDVLSEESPISPEAWQIRANVTPNYLICDRAPARFTPDAAARNSMISAGCVIEGTVENSILSPGVCIGKGAVVKDSIIFDDCVIGPDAVVDLSILDKRVKVGSGAKIGIGDDRTTPNRTSPKHLYTGISLIGKEAVIPARATIGRNCIVSPFFKPASATLELPTGDTV